MLWYVFIRDKDIAVHLGMDEMDMGLFVQGGAVPFMIVSLLQVALRYHFRDDSRAARVRIQELVRACPAVDVGHVVKWLLDYTEASCILLDIDEANKIEVGDLTNILRVCCQGIGCGLRMYISVTGNYKETVPTSVDHAGYVGVNIFLPPLSMKQCFSIMESFGLISADENVNPFFSHLVMLAGGVPRYLDYLISSIATRALNSVSFKLSEVPLVNKFISYMNFRQMQDILRYWKQMCEFLTPLSIPQKVIAGIVSLVVSEESVILGRVKDFDLGVTNYTIENALNQQLLYVQSATAGNVTVPPLLLSHLHDRCSSGTMPSVHPLHSLEGIMCSRDNESLYLSVIIHRMRAAQILGCKYTWLYQLLGVASVNGQADVMIDVSSADRMVFKKINKAVTASNYFDTMAADFPAKVNMPTAPFADAFIRFDYDYVDIVMI
jgi:hypothetical protein